MSEHLARRHFLKLSLAAAGPACLGLSAGPARAEPKPVPGADQLTAYQLGPHIWIRWANNLLTSYRAHPTQKYPYFYPLTGPASGLSLTTETSLPYPHHRSMVFACDKVNGGNYWQGELAAGQIISTGPRLGECTPTTAEIFDQCEWKQPEGPVVMRDERKFTVTVAGPNLRLIDAEIKWIAAEDVTIPRTNHSLFALRAAPDLSVWGGGTLVNSEGASGEKDTFGKPAAWCGYHGKRLLPQEIPGDVIEGIALMDHPNNPWAPCPWFTRDYGFISPTPFNFRDEPWQLPAGESVALRYRVVLHTGTPEEAQLDKLYRDWASAS